MNRVLWHTMTIKIPSEMVEYNEKTGKVSIRKTLTRTLMISKSRKKPAIKLISSSNISKPEIVNPGKEWDVDKLKESLKKAKTLGDKNKNKPQKKLGTQLVKGVKSFIANKKEQRANKILSDADKILNELKKIKPIKIKEGPKTEDRQSVLSYLNQVILKSSNEEIMAALLKLGYRPSIGASKIATMHQLAHNFKTIEKMKKLINAIESIKEESKEEPMKLKKINYLI